jgi:HlyD family secretion protein
LAIKESLVQYDRKSEKPYVEILKEKNTFERIDLKLGISDGIDVEVLEGLGKNDLVKVWNKASKEDDEDKKKETKRRK